MQVIGQRRPRGLIGEPDRGQPRAVLQRPRHRRPLVVDLATQQELPDPVARAHQVRADVLAAADQITQLLTLDRWDRDEYQLPGRQQSGQADRVALVGLDPVRGRPVGLARRAHRNLDPLRPRATRQPVARRTGLIHHPGRTQDLPQRRQQLVRAAHHPPRQHLARRLIEHRERRLARVHVQTDPTDTVRHRYSSRSLWAPRRGRNPQREDLPRRLRGECRPLRQPQASSSIVSIGLARSEAYLGLKAILVFTCVVCAGDRPARR